MRFTDAAVLIILTLALCAFPGFVGATNWCATLNSQSTEAAALLDTKVDDGLTGKGKFFTKSSLGWALNIVNATSGNENGGATNPDGSYGIVAFPTTDILPDGLCDLPACTNSSKMECHPRCTPDPTGATSSLWSYSYIMGYSDVVVLTTCTPPPVKYYSYDHIISTRWNQEYPFYPGQNFGDAINMADIDSASKDEKSAFLSPKVIIASADAHAAELVKRGYIDVGFDEKSIMIRGIESDTVRMWDRSGGKTVQDSRPDIMFSVMRASIPVGESLEDIKKWEKLVWPTRFYFASDETTQPVEALHPPLTPRESPAVMNEVEMYGPILSSLRKATVSSLSPSYDLVGVTLLDYNVTGFYDDWDSILHNPSNNSFIIPIRDSTYGIPIIPKGSDVSIHPDTYAVITGVIHTETIHAVYSEVSVALENFLTNVVLGTIAFEENEDLKGSALRYFDSESLSVKEAVAAGVDPSLLYAVDIRAPGACKEEEAAFCFELDDQYIRHKYLAMILGSRTYSLKATGVGPPANSTTSALLQVFKKEA